ncbi:Os1348 family NHLP clan protein [Streptomyces sp. WI04-05B]|uniref:Os1348 family NHLP clan protein n=1 Tax=Streptomyces TaxID=1883 RepID=UPI0029BA6693|nr:MULTISPECIES: Os1348 family NHLP clan protein [unclassified Streptomyces]MDX2545382.1 Os1348 family NHLP clan protein [Streptomyces sp. WI04-05B]MDX2588123.1 Os1348 family NHLP clan protein [Streptomyces sp. WI04-05A]MDX3749116.1 Os1348 family NHLP clan protein [Streptomyces sp. AK08-02]
MSIDESTPETEPETEEAAEQTEPNRLREVLERVTADADFARRLLDDPDEALAGYELSEVQLLLLRSLDEADLEKLTPENLDEYFAVDSAVYTPEDAAMVQQGYEVYDEEELEG